MSNFGAQPDGSVRWRPVEKFTLPRRNWTGDEWSNKLGGWMWGTDTDGSPLLMVRCGREECGGALTLPRHKVDSDGKVTPSIGCSWCGWHVWGTLEDYEPPEPQ